MAESRQELVNWVNDLLLVNITKVEQCGTGAIFCQILDSIYMDLPMSKVKFDANNEYQYLGNFKVLQSTFTKYRIDRVIPVEKLVKCRFQDNLEFLQWARRYWDANFPGTEYDPLSRRKGPVGAKLSGTAGTMRPSSRNVGYTNPSGTASQAPRTIASPASRPRPVASTNGGVRRPPSVQRGVMAGGSTALTAAKEKVKELTEENEQLITAVDLVESERDFYFQKLRDIEVLIQTAADQLDAQGDEQQSEVNGDNNEESADDLEGALNKLNLKESAKAHSQLIREIQTILYSTTEGFEIPTQEFETEETF